MADRVPLRLGPRTLTVGTTEATALRAFEQLRADQHRLLRTNLTLAHRAGELDDLPATLAFVDEEFARTHDAHWQEFLANLRAAGWPGGV